MNDKQSVAAIRYEVPRRWIVYNPTAVLNSLAEAKAAVMSLTSVPYQRDWVETLQQIQLKMEVAGTSQIEGAEFTDRELDLALNPNATAEELITLSQRQARAAVATYRWIAELPHDLPLDESLIKEVHSRLVTGCDDDHCPPGRLRARDQNVVFGVPMHRGCEGGEECSAAFAKLVDATRHEFKEHDPLIQALALHYHFAAMHPFLDGNGRTARALESLLHQRAGLRDTAFIAMSNYYYDHKAKYLDTLSGVRAADFDLTNFLIFGLKGLTIQCKRLLVEIRIHIQQALFRNTMYDLFNRLATARTRVLRNRQIEILKVMLEVKCIEWRLLSDRVKPHYTGIKNFNKTVVRDTNSLREIGAITVTRNASQPGNPIIGIDLEWPQKITETDFFLKVSTLPKSKTSKFL